MPLGLIDMETFLQAGAMVFGLVMAFAPILQIRRMRHTGSAQDISLSFLLVIAIGAAFYGSYGVYLGVVAYIIPNFLGVLTNLGAAFYGFRLRRPARLPRHDASAQAARSR